jgi:hypothetical protein
MSRLANPHLNFVIASRGQMASFPAGTTPCFLEIESAPGSFLQEIPCSLDDAADQQHAPSLLFRYSVFSVEELDSNTLVLNKSLPPNSSLFMGW